MEIKSEYDDMSLQEKVDVADYNHHVAIIDPLESSSMPLFPLREQEAYLYRSIMLRTKLILKKHCS